MKIVLIISSFLLGGMAIGQNSYYFSEPVPSKTDKVEQVDTRWFGNYQGTSTSITYECTAEGIFAVSTNISSISRTIVRESSDYSVRNGFLFGVVKNDSIPFVEQGDYYFFGVRNRETIIGPGSMNVLTKMDATHYVINYYENGSFTPVKLTFNGKSLTLSDFDYELETDAFDFIQKKTTIPSQHQNLVILSPTTEEFSRINSSTFFVSRNLYTKL